MIHTLRFLYFTKKFGLYGNIPTLRKISYFTKKIRTPDDQVSRKCIFGHLTLLMQPAWKLGLAKWYSQSGRALSTTSVTHPQITLWQAGRVLASWNCRSHQTPHQGCSLSVRAQLLLSSTVVGPSPWERSSGYLLESNKGPWEYKADALPHTHPKWYPFVPC